MKKESKNTKRALVASIGCVALCSAMLVGTTFAWFTDTATTSVSKIQAGTLDVALLNENNESVEGKTLSFTKAADGSGEKVLWEPGCTYELPAVYVKNNGNLALKYKIQITGIDGDAKLNQAIEWTISDGSETTSLNSDHSLAAGAKSKALTIKGHMKESAGNEYQNRSIDGIRITVAASQDTVEYDSTTNKYDDNATYPAAEEVSVATADEFTAALANVTDGGTVVLSEEMEISSDKYSIQNPLVISANDVTIDLNGKTLTDTNYSVKLMGNNITVKNGTIVAATTNKDQEYGSYGIVVNGKDAVIDGVTMTGGISVSTGDSSYPGASATIKNCDITATNYYTVCAQGGATAEIRNSKLTANKGVAFFYVEGASTETGYVYGASSLSYEKSTVTMTGTKPLYTTAGIAPIEI